MALDLTNEDHNTLDRYLEGVLDAYKDGRVSRFSARSNLAEAVALAAKDRGGFFSYIRIPFEDDRDA